MQHHSFTFNPFYENTYIVWDDTKQCIIIDPGCSNAQEEKTLANFITENNLIPKKIVLTHGHIDHVLGVGFCVGKWNLPVYINKIDMATMEYSIKWGVSMGFNIPMPVAKYISIEEGDTLTFGQTNLDVLFLPGHAPGHLGYYNKTTNEIFQGDVLFRQGIGRYDLPGGDYDTLISSIKNKLFALPVDCKVYSGHGEPTTIGFEKSNNPYLQP